MTGRLSALQERILATLAAGVTEPWVLTGGAALGGFYTMHRSTRDLDITPIDRRNLGALPETALRCLQQDGLQAQAHRLSRQHWQLDVSDGAESVVVEFVAGWAPAAESPRTVVHRGREILVESSHELLVRKLTAAFDRSEPRDIEDIQALLRAGGDLHRAVVDAGRAFSGLTAATFAGTLRSLPLARLARIVGWSDDKVAEMSTFRDELVRELVPDDID